MTTTLRAIARTATAISLGMGAIQAAHAETRTLKFTFDWDNGPLGGQTTTGQFSFDSSLFHPTQYVRADQLFSDLSVEIDGRTSDEQQGPGHYRRFHPDGRLRMVAVGNNCGPVICYVDNPQDWSIAWDGSNVGYALYARAPHKFSYASVVEMQEISAVPEPASWALMLVGAAAVAGRWHSGRAS